MADEQNSKVNLADKSIYEIEASIASDLRSKPLTKSQEDHLDKLKKSAAKYIETRNKWRSKHLNNVVKNNVTDE